MTDFNIRSDSVNVEDVMRQIRARIREKRGVDYTEQEIRELAAVKLERFLDPTKVRSDLLEQYRQLQRDQANPDTSLGEEALFGTARGWLRRVRRLLRPILKLFLNPVPLERAARVDTTHHAELFFELVHNLVVETTRLGIEVKTLKMRVESLSSRLDFDERRARAFEGVVQGRPAERAEEPAPAPAATRREDEEAEGEPGMARSRRRRRRRGRRGGQRAGTDEGAGAGDGQAHDNDRPPRADHPAAAVADAAQAAPVNAPEGSGASAGRADEQPPAASGAAGSSRPAETGQPPERDAGSREPGS